MDRSYDYSAIWVQKVFASPWTAYATLFATMFVLVGIYLGINSVRTRPKVPWDTAVRLSEDGRFQPSFRQAVLERFFSEKELTRGQDIIKQKCQEARNAVLVQRRHIFREIKVFCQKVGDPLYTDRPSLLKSYKNMDADANKDAFRTNANLKAAIQEYTNIGAPLGLFEKDPSEWRDEDVLITRLPNLIAILKTMMLDIGAKTRENGNVLVEKLKNQDKNEAEVRTEIKEEIKALEPPLSFIWLYHEGTGWIFEVVFWTWFGVLANSVITVILVSKDGKYDPGLFALVIPKFFLAPLISVVFVALWAAGLTDSKVTFLSLPWFMAFCFFLGFMTESLYARLRKFADAIIGGATVSSGRLPGAPGRDYHQWRHLLTDVKDLVKPATLSELKTLLEKTSQAIMEREIVIGKSQEKE